MAFEDYLSEQGKRKTTCETPMQAISRAGQVHEDIFGTGRGVRPVTERDWQRLYKADEAARRARNLFLDGTLDKTGR